jgi:hypothetical protein
MGVAVGREAPIQRSTLFSNEANRSVDAGGGFGVSPFRKNCVLGP